LQPCAYEPLDNGDKDEATQTTIMEMCGSAGNAPVGLFRVEGSAGAHDMVVKPSQAALYHVP
jgi:hypothetical protein